MAELRRVELWGYAVPLESLSVSDIQSRITLAREGTKHTCAAGRNCPLRIQFGDVIDNLQRLQAENRGLDLSDVVREG